MNKKTTAIIITLCIVLAAATVAAVGIAHYRFGVFSHKDSGKGDREGAGNAEAGEEEGEESDLDLGVDELFSRSCEHGVPTYTCDECRYEVGVVKVDPGLIRDGLVQVEEVGERALEDPLQLTGEISFNEKKVAHVSPPLPGIIKKVNVDLQQEVKAGQVLFSITSVELAGSGGDYMKAVAARDVASKNMEREQELFDVGGASKKDLLEARAASDMAKIDVEAQEQKLVGLGLSKGAVKSLASGKGGIKSGSLGIRSPIGGTILDLHAVTGELVQPGDDVILIGDIGSLWVWVDIYEDDLRQIVEAWKKGNVTAVVGVRAYPEEEFPGFVDFISSTMDEKTRTVRARITFDNADKKLRPGMFGKVKLFVLNGEKVMAIPSEAVLSDEGREFVFVNKEDGYYVRRPVYTGRQLGGFVEIKKGLEPGQKVVTRGAFLLKSDVLRSKMGAGCAD